MPLSFVIELGVCQLFFVACVCLNLFAFVISLCQQSWSCLPLLFVNGVSLCRLVIFVIEDDCISVFIPSTVDAKYLKQVAVIDVCLSSLSFVISVNLSFYPPQLTQNT